MPGQDKDQYEHIHATAEHHWDQQLAEGWPSHETPHPDDNADPPGIVLDPEPSRGRTGQTVVHGDESNRLGDEDALPTPVDVPLPERPPSNLDGLKLINSRVCTISWIHESSLAGRLLADTPPPARVSYEFIKVAELRFANFISGWIYSDGTNVVAGNFGVASGLHARGSFMGLQTEAGDTWRAKEVVIRGDGIQGVRFEQTAGARTLVGEQALSVSDGIPLLGHWVRDLAKAYGAEHLFDFPPIWTRVGLVIYADGAAKWSFPQASLFPCHTFYFQHPTSNHQDSNMDRVQQIMSGSRAQYNWHQRGWRDAKRRGLF